MSEIETLQARLKAARIPEILRHKLRSLSDDLASLESCLVAFSGGVDSAFLAYVASRIPGLKMEAVTAKTSLVAPGELEAASAFAAAQCIPHQTIIVDPLSDPLVRSNPVDRCYHCKKLILEKIRGHAEAHGFETILEGENADDLRQRRPGRQAVEESGTRSPLARHGFSKDEIRLLSRALGLATWNKPSSPCLATRIPYGTEITLNDLHRVGSAEEYLRKKGFQVARVRCLGEQASVEVEAGRIQDLLSIHEEVKTAFQEIGFQHTMIDLHGYRSGSLDEGMEL